MSSQSEAGPELDGRIAKAVGFNWDILGGECIIENGPPDGIGHGWRQRFPASTELNAAMQAAEKRGLLKGSEFFMHRDEDAWEVGMLYRIVDTGKADSLPLAICRYIENFADTRVEIHG